MNKFLNIGFILLLSACNYSHDKVQDSVLNPQKATPPPAKITYKDVSAAVLEPACLSCHSESTGNKGGINLETYAKVFASKDAIKASVASKDMPKAPHPPLNDQQIKMIIDWIEAGALENGADAPPTGGTPPPAPTPSPTPNPTPTPVNISYSMVHEKVIKTNCLKCHTAIAGNKGDVNLENYKNVSGKINDIKSQIEGGTMPPTDGGKPLTDEQKKLILKWIEQGAPEDPK